MEYTMKIGIDARLWNESGVGRYLRNLVTELGELDKKNEYVLFFKKAEFTLVELPSKNFKKVLADVHWHTLTEQIVLPRILQKENLDLMHFPYFSIPLFYRGKFVVTIHDLILHHYTTGKATTLPKPLYFAKQAGYRFVIGKAVQKAQAIIAVSNATKKEIIDHLHVSSSKVSVLYEGVTVVKQIKTNESSIKIPYFLHVGNMYPHKNVQQLIDAFAQAFTNENVALVFAGKEDFFYKEMQRYVQKNTTQNIYFLGYVSDSELEVLYTHARAVVVPSFMEGFGLPAVEAMARECVVIVSDIPVHREICGEAGVYFDPTKKEELALCLKNVSKKPKKEFQKNIASGMEKIKNYSWKTMAKETIDVYERSVSV